MASTSAQVALAWIIFPTLRRTRRSSSVDVLCGLALLASLAIILRLELVGLLLPLALQALLSGSVTLWDGLSYGVIASLGAMGA
jgi:hypothetical protein